MMVLVKDTKKSNFRRLDQMNGDFLVHLKQPLRGEANSYVKGHNNASRMQLRRQLNTWYNDKNLAVTKIKRSQVKVYKTLVSVHLERRRLQWVAWKKKQDLEKQLERERELAENPPADETEVVTGEKKGEVVQESKQVVKETGSNLTTQLSKTGVENPQKGDLNNQSDPHLSVIEKRNVGDISKGSDSKNDHIDKGYSNNNAQAENIERKTGKLAEVSTEGKTRNDISDGLVKSRHEVTRRSRVLEVRKGNYVEPLSRERSQTFIEEKPRAAFISTQGESNLLHDVKNSLEKDLCNKNGGLEGKTKNAEASNDQAEININKLDATPSSFLPGVSVRIDCEKTLGRGNDRKTKSLDLKPLKIHGSLETSDYLNRPLSCDEGKVKKRKVVSLAKLNKLRAKERDETRKRLLDNEKVPVYRRDISGEIVPDMLPFKRQEFAPPTGRERRIRQRLVEAQSEAKRQERIKVLSFITKLDEEELAERLRLEELVRQREEAVRLLREQRKKLRHQRTLPKLQDIFIRSQLPPDVDPDSPEALRLCRYLREHAPLSKEMKEEARRNKVSSWDL